MLSFLVIARPSRIVIWSCLFFIHFPLWITHVYNYPSTAPNCDIAYICLCSNYMLLPELHCEWRIANYMSWNLCCRLLWLRECMEVFFAINYLAAEGLQIILMMDHNMHSKHVNINIDIYRIAWHNLKVCSKVNKGEENIAMSIGQNVHVLLCRWR